jgi:hypothetical protein
VYTGSIPVVASQGSALAPVDGGPSTSCIVSVWKLVLCLRHFRPELDVVTVATPWTGLTLVSGFTGGDSGFAECYDEAVARFIDMPYSALGDDPLTALDVVPNDWDVVRPQLEHLRRGAEDVDADSPHETPMPSVNGAAPQAVTGIAESLRHTQLELIYTRHQYRRVDTELLAALAQAGALGAALDAA